MTFLTYLISGLALGSVYAIIALGYTMVYGIAKMLNFAHGDIIMAGGYVAFFAFTRFGLPAWACVVLSIVACTLLGVIIERLAYKPLRQASSLSVLITAIGVSYFLQNGSQLLFGSDTKIFPPMLTQGSLNLFDGSLTISYLTLLTIFICLAIMVVLTLFINKTKIGKAMRACCPADGHQCRHDDLDHLCDRFRSGCHCSGLAVLHLSILVTDAWLNARHQGLYGCRLRWHRFDSRCLIGRSFAGHDRKSDQSLHIDAVIGCDRIYRIDRRLID